MPSFIDLTNRRFERLIVLVRVDGPRTYWLCKCDCGNEKRVRAAHLVSGLIRSCGCLSSELSSARAPQLQISNTKTGLSKSQTYSVWANMKGRCTNPQHQYFKYYGGRGIKVCERWHQFEHFLADMGLKPPGMTIDRINNDGDYEPGNCRWVTRTVQQNNRRVNRVIEHDGKSMTLTEWARANGIHRNTLEQRLAKGIPLNEAIVAPLKRSR